MFIKCDRHDEPEIAAGQLMQLGRLCRRVRNGAGVRGVWQELREDLKSAR